MSPRGKARTVGVGIVGFGFMGHTHLDAYRSAAAAGFPNRVVALCDGKLARFGANGRKRGNLGKPAAGRGPALRGVALHAEAEELFRDDSIELVSLCTPTDTHVPLALAALRAGKHVLVEKPVALEAAAVARLAAAARKARRVCMPAMCMRFWPGWDWLKKAVEKRTYGKTLSVVFRRMSPAPTWSRDFYGDPSRSGGALFDLHVHDADLVRWCFGQPASVFSRGSREHVTTLYHFPKGPKHVVAEGGWADVPGFPFFMGYTAVFERATAEYALGREPALTLTRRGTTRAVALAEGTGYDGEVRHMLRVVARGVKQQASMKEAVELTRMLAAEQRSLASGRSVSTESHSLPQ